jgi:hypothetical protein
MTAVIALMLVDASGAAGQTTERSRVSFRLTSETCSRLPSGTVLRGSGRQRSTTTTITNANGTSTVVNYTRARGVARSTRGPRYRFDYQNSFAVTNTVENPALYTGTMFDVFELVRRGRTTLHNGFVATYTTDLGQSNTYTSLYAFGDPVEFPSGAAHCDPL